MYLCFWVPTKKRRVSLTKNHGEIPAVFLSEKISETLERHEYPEVDGAIGQGVLVQSRRGRWRVSGVTKNCRGDFI